MSTMLQKHEEIMKLVDFGCKIAGAKTIDEQNELYEEIGLFDLNPNDKDIAQQHIEKWKEYIKRKTNEILEVKDEKNS